MPADEALIRRAIVAAQAATLTGDVPIGAVVIDADGRELAVAGNAREALSDPTAHAEILALRAAAAVRGEWRLEGCTLAVTVEPCTMCAGAIGLARIARVVFGAWEPKTGAVGSLWDVLRDRRLTHRPEVVGGVLAAECAALLEAFFDEQRRFGQSGARNRSPVSAPRWSACGTVPCCSAASPAATAGPCPAVASTTGSGPRSRAAPTGPSGCRSCSSTASAAPA